MFWPLTNLPSHTFNGLNVVAAPLHLHIHLQSHANGYRARLAQCLEYLWLQSLDIFGVILNVKVNLPTIAPFQTSRHALQIQENGTLRVTLLHPQSSIARHRF